MIKIGLTGSIGMGKSTTARMFKDQGVPVWDADAAVSRLYGENGEAVPKLAEIVPSAINENSINRDTLKALIKQNSGLLKQLETIVHPLVAKDRERFLATHSKAEIVLFDIPLLFENGTEDQMDVVIVVSASAAIQKTRVLSRGTMDEDTFEMIRSKQMPDEEKRKRANYVIETTSIDHASQQVQTILIDLRNQ